MLQVFTVVKTSASCHFATKLFGVFAIVCKRIDSPIFAIINNNNGTRRSKIVSRATGRYAATSFDQLLVCPMSSFVGVAYFFYPPRLYCPFSRFPKKCYEEGNYT